MPLGRKATNRKRERRLRKGEWWRAGPGIRILLKEPGILARAFSKPAACAFGLSRVGRNKGEKRRLNDRKT